MAIESVMSKGKSLIHEEFSVAMVDNDVPSHIGNLPQVCETTLLPMQETISSSGASQTEARLVNPLNAATRLF